MKNSYTRRGEISSTVVAETGSSVYNVITLPFSRFSACIYKRSILLVKCACLTLPVSRIIIAVKNLDFIEALKINTAVAPSLAVTDDFRR